MKNRQETINRLFWPCLILFFASGELHDAGSGRWTIYLALGPMLLAVMVYNRLKIDCTEEALQREYGGVR